MDTDDSWRQAQEEEQEQQELLEIGDWHERFAGSATARKQPRIKDARSDVDSAPF
jgi:hypothetical protein